MNLVDRDNLIIGADISMIVYVEDEFKLTDTFTASIRDQDENLIGSFICLPETITDLSTLDEKLSGSGIVCVMTLNASASAIIPEGIYKSDLKQVTAAGATYFPVKQFNLQFTNSVT